MRVLVTAASSHGATTNIASVIGGTLHVHGLEVDVVPLADVKTLDGYDAVILGSGVYTGHWLREALSFARRHRKQLAQKSVWLFSSGPIGDPPRPLEEPAGIAELVEATSALGHKLFAGRLRYDELNLVEKMVARTIHAPDGDFRNWRDIHAWADEIAEVLQPDKAISDEHVA
jgi:menaquinone-dependent protoporphyrinogen oxidase